MLQPSTSPAACRQAIRKGDYARQTSGVADGYVQANLAILPEELAGDFLRFCHFNPKPCPLLAMTEPGDPMFRTLGEDIDVRTDLPGYKLFRKGAFVEEMTDISAIWRDDLVAFAIGCSISFEAALLDAGVPLRHVELDRTVPMYRSTIETARSGPFGGGMVVSMRPMLPADAIRAVQVTSRFPEVHGAPVHLGDPALIGIKDLDRPDFGEPTIFKENEIPVFWACGVTPQVAIEEAAPDFAISHAPGRMLIADIRNAEIAAL